jgi:hypothetical protein
VITVLNIAMMTSMVNTFGEMTPRSKPTLITISSIKPRVFIMNPMPVDSARLKPERRAAK